MLADSRAIWVIRMSENLLAVKTALLSVSDKSALIEQAKALRDFGVRLISTGGTYKALKQAGLEVEEVAEITGFGEMMDGRVKTLHPKIHGGLLANRDEGEHVAALREHGIPEIDMLIVNLYPFEQTLAGGADFATCVENIDIGGPAMIRAAAKNHKHVVVCVDNESVDEALAEMKQHAGKTSPKLRLRLAHKAFARTAQYDAAISNWLGAVVDGEAESPAKFPRTFTRQFSKALELRYGENPHQSAAFYVADEDEASISTARQLQGKALSYNNIMDTDAALECVKQFDLETDGPACVVLKHANPCGVALGKNNLEAYERAFSTDPESAFGGIIAFNGPLDGETAGEIIRRQFVEVIIAPTISEAARKAVAKKKNVRLLECGNWPKTPTPRLDYKKVTGGLLVQDADLALHETLEVVTEKQPTKTQMRDLLFAWKVCKFVKSNAIIYAKDGMTIGVGAGQMSRVNSARIARIKAEQAGLDLHGTAVASDAFFPFADGLLAAAEAGAACVIQPGGSIRDKEVIEAANEAGLAMVFTGMRHFRH